MRRALSPSAVMRTMALALGSLARLSTLRRPVPAPTTVPVFAISNIEKDHGVTRKELGVFDVCVGQNI